MKKSTLWFVALIAISGFSFTVLSHAPVKKSINITDFTGIRVNGNYQVFLKQGSKLKVKIEGDETDVKKVSTKVKDGIWSIQSQFNRNNKCSNYNNYSSQNKTQTPMKIYITMPKLTSIALNGAGKVSTDGNFKVKTIDLGITGNGKMRLNLNANSIEGNLCGSGKLVLKGTAKHLEAKVTGSGDVDAEAMKVENVNVSITGSGDINIHATEHLKAKISGSGDIFYKGSPSIHKKITGSGGVSRL
ncbi:MAG: head GIN domain-containing protein [Saprospiraceae bacterium]